MKGNRKYFVIGVLFALLLAVLPSSMASADEGDIYTVSYNLTGVVVSPAVTEATEGSSLTMEFAPDEGYSLPNNVTVEAGGFEMTDGYTYDDGILTINEVYGNITITAAGITEPDESASYSISYDLYKVKASKQDGNVKAGTSYSVKLKANSGFKLNPANVAVSVDGEYIYNGYSYDDGVLVIDSVNGDVVIEAIAVPVSSSDKKTDNNKTNTSSSNNTSGSSNKPSGSNSKSGQALSKTGGSAVNYNTGSYRAPRTGDGIDIRYYGALALIFIGAGCFVTGRKSRYM